MRFLVTSAILISLVAYYLQTTYGPLDYTELVIEKLPYRKELYFRNARNDLWLRFYEWEEIPNPNAPASVVLLLHGAGEYAGTNAYENLTRALNDANILVYGFDFEGHGHS
jgi:pimeloyl-ACP methyl ester carboxylesterase